MGAVTSKLSEILQQIPGRIFEAFIQKRAVLFLHITLKLKDLQREQRVRLYTVWKNPLKLFFVMSVRPIKCYE